MFWKYPSNNTTLASISFVGYYVSHETFGNKKGWVYFKGFGHGGMPIKCECVCVCVYVFVWDISSVDVGFRLWDLGTPLCAWGTNVDVFLCVGMHVHTHLNLCVSLCIYEWKFLMCVCVCVCFRSLCLKASKQQPCVTSSFSRAVLLSDSLLLAPDLLLLSPAEYGAEHRGKKQH